jgi:polyisoprenoid-binding protein YceI
MRRALCLLPILLMATAAFGADRACVMPGRGHFRIEAGTAGFFGAFAHEHVIEAEKVGGCATIETKDMAHSSIKLDFATAGLRVLDPKEKAEDRAKVQKTMETDVLRISEYPHVIFESTAAKSTGTQGQLMVQGTLTIRGITKPVSIPVTVTRLNDGTYRAVGEYRFKQTSFQIKPIQLAGGTVKVKDELRAEFELFLK